MVATKVLRGVLTLRFWVIGGAVVGGITLKKKYDEWKEYYVNFKWLDDVLPDTESWNKFTGTMISVKDKMKDSVVIDPRIKALSQKKYDEMKQCYVNSKWLTNALSDAESWNKFTGTMISVKDKMKDSVVIDPRIKALSKKKYDEWKNWFGGQSDNAIEAAETKKIESDEAILKNQKEIDKQEGASRITKAKSAITQWWR